jgi:cytochrome c553
VKLNLTTTAAILLATTFAIPAMAQSAGDTYNGKCQMCHLADGTGNKGLKVPPFTAAASDADMTAAIKNGKGTGAIKMPSYTGKLTDDQIKALVIYIHTLAK